MDAQMTNTLLKVIPEAEKVLALEENCVRPSNWGATFWKANVEDSEGDEVEYFIKVVGGQAGYESLRGEYESASLIDTACSGVCPKPIAFGTFDHESALHFCIFTFYELQESLPDIDFLSEQLSVLHSYKSPNGKFGFDFTTYNGNLPQKNDWCESWEAFFAASMKDVLRIREERAGPSSELEELLPALFEKVIPRLLQPLETGGRKVTPVLVHGNLWRGNVAAVKDSPGRGVIFDSASFFAHNEYEFGNWRPERNGFARKNIEQYTSLPGVGKSAPEEDFWDRNALYALRFDCQAAALYPQDESFLELVIEGTKALVNKFPSGLKSHE